MIGIAMAALSNQSLAKASVFGLLSSCSALLEQFPIKASDGTHVAFLRTINVMVLPLLFAALVITSTYRGIMKSNYMLEATYSTPWKSLSQLNGFDFIIAYEGDGERFHMTINNPLQMIECCPPSAGVDVYDQDCAHKMEPQRWASICEAMRLLGYPKFECKACYFFDSARTSKGSETSGWLRRNQQFLVDMVIRSNQRVIRRGNQK